MIAWLKDLYQRDFVKNVTHSLFSKGILILISMVISIIITRTLGPELKGKYFLVLSLIAIGSQFGNLGLHSVNVHYSAKNPSLRDRLLGNSLLYSIIVGVPLGGVFLVFGWKFIPEIWQHNGVAICILIGIPLTLMRLFLRQIIIGSQEIKLHNKLEIIGIIFYLAIVLYAYFRDISALNIFIIFFIIENSFSILILLYSLTQQLGIKLRFDYRTFKKTLPYGIRAYIITLLAFLVIRSDIILINHFITDPRELGYYSTAVQIADKFALIGTIIASILMPRLSSDKDNSEKLRLQQKASRFSSLILLGILIPALFLSKTILYVLFGSAFVPGTVYLQILLIATFFLSIESVMAQFLASIGIPIKLIWYWILALIINSTLNIILLPKMGTIAAAYSSVISYFIVFILVFRLIMKYSSSLRSK